jgi:hypothetical protein
LSNSHEVIGLVAHFEGRLVNGFESEIKVHFCCKKLKKIVMIKEKNKVLTEQLLSDNFTSISLFGERPLIALILASWVDLSNSNVVFGKMQEDLGLV